MLRTTCGGDSFIPKHTAIVAYLVLVAPGVDLEGHRGIMTAHPRQTHGHTGAQSTGMRRRLSDAPLPAFKCIGALAGDEES